MTPSGIELPNVWLDASNYAMSEKLKTEELTLRSEWWG
jgi:hypothetical protein